MLNAIYIRLSAVYVLILLILQLWLLFHLQLFGDESFYWLEGQFLSLSYAELPGWTAWMIRLGTSVFGNNYFAVRIVSYLGFLSIFLAIYLINKKLNHQSIYTQQININYLTVLAIPLFVLVGVMALPDVWLIVFVMWIIYFFIKAINNNQSRDWLVLGLIMACGLNVHVRMWIWLFFAGLSFLICFHTSNRIIKSVLFLTLPVALLGMIPVLVFNYHNDYALFSFQFEQRHPWQFQIQNFSFLLSQLLVITPIVLWLWIKNLSKIKIYFGQHPFIAWILLTALIHWVFYVIMSLFADGLRTTVHWLLISYVPVLAISSVLIKNKSLIKFAMVSGGVISLMFLSYLSLHKGHSSNIQARILDNSLGWHELSKVVARLQKQNNTKNLITDYFMTASELAFELDRTDSIKVLPHQKNIKHGRQKQLQIMRLLLQHPKTFKKEALLVVEDSGIKLQDKGKYYIQLCQYFKQLQLLESVSVAHTKKQFHVFKVNNKDDQAKSCDIPPLFYVQQDVVNNQVEISGWAILHNSGIQSLLVMSAGESMTIEKDRMINKGIAIMFPEINDTNQPNNAFKIVIPMSKLRNNSYQIFAISNDNREYLSQNYFIE